MKKVILWDGRRIIGKPWIYRERLETDSCQIRILVAVKDELEENETVPILMIYEHFPGALIYLPNLALFKKEFWTEGLVQAVAEELRAYEDKKPFEYLAGKLIAAFRRKELVLQDGRTLVGELSFLFSWSTKPGHLNISISGNIESEHGYAEGKMILFTIMDVCASVYVDRAKPRYIKNSQIWNKKVEFVIVNYLNLLIDFSSGMVSRDLKAILKDLVEKSEWTVTCRKIFSQLMNLSPDDRERPEIIKAIRLLGGVSETG